MQQPAVFHEDRPEILHDFIERNSFAMLVTVQGDEPAADHLPLHLKKVGAEGRAVLQGHLAAVNRLGRTTEVPRHALAVFQGPQSYISPFWYPSKAAHGKVVPTWNYVAVHARGLLRLHKDEDWLLRHLDELTRRHESARPVPWSVLDAPREFIARQLRGLVGLEIEITGLQGVWKASQNKTAEDAAGVAAGLRQVDAPQSSAMAALVSMLGNRRPGTQEP